LPAYLLAIDQGADFIEPDLVMTRDGVLVVRHENDIGGTTDVAAHPEFASRRRRQRIDGVEVDGWFTEDFTFEELRRLRARERLPDLRPESARSDNRFAIPSFAEVLDFLAAVNATRRRRGQNAVGIYPETKHPTHFRHIGLPLEPALLAALRDGLGEAPVFIQSFEVGNLRLLREQCDHPLVQLIDETALPWDREQARDLDDVRQLLQPAGLRDIARYASGIGPAKRLVVPADPASGGLGPATRLVADAHDQGLVVHCWTFRAENTFLPPSLRRGGMPQAHGDLMTELSACLAAGIDGFFTDQPDYGRLIVAA
jgi:glycerophosphoryl diester phosphodiesterase